MILVSCDCGLSELRLAHDFSSRFVRSDAEESRMPKFAVNRPLDEADGGRRSPVAPSALAREANRRRVLNGLRGNFERVEPRAEVEQELGVEAGADLAGEAQILHCLTWPYRAARRGQRGCPVDP